jgi:hypothetical protein
VNRLELHLGPLGPGESFQGGGANHNRPMAIAAALME